MTKLLNLAAWLPRSSANGPGTRMVLWVQGCPFRCPGCQNPDFLQFRLNQVVTVDDVWQVFQQLPDLAGVSFSGGEPFAQAVALAELASLVQSAGKTVVCWTGYRLEQLKSGQIKGAIHLLQSIDLLIDGLFIQQQLSDDTLRGSHNQQLHFLSGRITPADLKNIPRQEWIINDAILTYTGFPIPGDRVETEDKIL
ncbi:MULTISPECIES: 4Fe-4S single cluster domain-containing protein [Calothrix]|uniref:Radical SAM protein n=2 Tax=Calothrix TaxID=1186 RepID=A0ABR8A618_9CYAN|nr:MULTISPECIES: 4Fe-4S single cluster domain-containing protein [Calothrix]MBD2195238.1 radical SAM protein [Calothrix parietina FACHB-288]MBD2223791.1 radical SAM protein [Calothrix anomala FACHB-343]